MTGRPGRRPFTPLRTRSEFLALRAAPKVGRPAFLLQIARRETGLQDRGEVRAGVTVTRKIGNAVVRNRIKRRFRAALTDILREIDLPPCDLNLVARPAALRRPYTALLDDLRGALLDPRTCAADPSARA